MDFLVYSRSLTMRIAHLCPSPYSCYNATGKKSDHDSFSDVVGFSVFCNAFKYINNTLFLLVYAEGEG